MTRRSTVCLLALVLVCGGLAGCLGTGDEPYRVGGAFTEDATQEDIGDLRARVKPYGATVVILESFPLQYIVHGFSQADCPAVRGILQAAVYVATVGPCEQDAQAEDGDEPASNGSGNSRVDRG